MPAVIRICGFKRSAFNLQSQQYQLQVTETIEIEAETPLTKPADIQAELPSITSGPGSTTFNPLQLTFTLGSSRHPDSKTHIFASILSFKKKSDNDRFWELTIQYATPQGWSIFGAVAIPDSERRDQKVLNPDVDPAVTDQVAITNPLNRPPVFSQSSKIVMAHRFFDKDGFQLIHTNMLPVDKALVVPVVNRVYRWNFNIDITKDYTTFLWDAENTCNSSDVTLEGEGTIEEVVKANRLKCNTATVTEVWETPSGSTTEYHYLRCNVELEQSPFPWNNAPVSMHMLELKNFVLNGGTYTRPIKINEAGNLAKAPWPLQPDGSAVPYDALTTTVKGRVGILDANDQYEAWEPVEPSSKIQDLLNEFDLELPKRKE